MPTRSRVKYRNPPYSCELKPKFLLDGMLGSLTRWLRISGYDSLYLNHMLDEELIKKTKETRRILLTRDQALVNRARKKGVEAYFIIGETGLEKLIDLREKLGLDYTPHNSRCPRCNGNIAKVPKEKVKNRVPEATYDNFEEFWICESCEAEYWMGSHWSKIKSTLEKANQIQSTT